MIATETERHRSMSTSRCHELLQHAESLVRVDWVGWCIADIGAIGNGIGIEPGDGMYGAQQGGHFADLPRPMACPGARRRTPVPGQSHDSNVHIGDLVDGHVWQAHERADSGVAGKLHA